MEKHTKQAESRVKIGLKRVIAFILVTRTKIRKSFELCNTLSTCLRGAAQLFIFTYAIAWHGLCIYIH